MLEDVGDWDEDFTKAVLREAIEGKSSEKGSVSEVEWEGDESEVRSERIER